MPFLASTRGSFGAQGRFGKTAGILGRTSANAANNALAILAEDSSSPSGVYWIKGLNATPMQMYCDMNGSQAGSSVGGWMRFDQSLVSTYRTTAIGEFLRRCTYSGSGRYDKQGVDLYQGGVRWDLGNTINFTGVRHKSLQIYSTNGPDGYGVDDRLGLNVYGTPPGTAISSPPYPTNNNLLADFINGDVNLTTNGTSFTWSAINSSANSIYRYWKGWYGQAGAGWTTEVNGGNATVDSTYFYQSDSAITNGRYLQWTESDGATEYDAIINYEIWLR
jgi:hypothetical protein